MADPLTVSAATPGSSNGNGHRTPKARYGVLQLGAARIALDIEAVREVVPAPPQLDAMPLPQPWIRGALDLRGTIVAVVDLAGLLGLQDVAATRSSVAIVVVEGLMVGLLVDSASDVAEIAIEQRQRLQLGGDDDRPRWLTHAFSWPQSNGHGSGIVSVLAVDTLMRVPDLPWVPAPDLKSRLSQADAEGLLNVTAQRRPYLYFRCGDILLGIEASLVHSSSDNPQVRAHFLSGEVCQGMVTLQGEDLAVIDLLAHLGLGRTGAEDRAHLVTLRMRDGLLGVLVSEVLEVLQVGPRDAQLLAAGAVQRPEQFDGVMERADGRGVLLLRGEAIVGHEALEGLASIHGNMPERGTHLAKTDATVKPTTTTATAQDSTPGADATAVPTPGGYLAFSASGPWLARLTDISEILPFPSRYTQTRQDHPQIVGMMLKGRESILLVSLNALLHRPAPMATPDFKVLVVPVGLHRIGFVVESLDAIEPIGFTVGDWRPKGGDAAAIGGAPLGSATASPSTGSGRIGDVEEPQLVALGYPPAQRLASCIELGALARQLVREVEPEPGSDAKTLEGLASEGQGEALTHNDGDRSTPASAAQDFDESGSSSVPALEPGPTEDAEASWAEADSLCETSQADSHTDADADIAGSDIPAEGVFETDASALETVFETVLEAVDGFDPTPSDQARASEGEQPVDSTAHSNDAVDAPDATAPADFSAERPGHSDSAPPPRRRSWFSRLKRGWGDSPRFP